jgi:hypothetical protein
MDPADLAVITAAFERGYADAAERQRYYSQQPGGVLMGWTPELDATLLAPAGLGYGRAPRADAIFEADAPGLVPHVLPVPVAVDLSAGPALTGATHGGWGLLVRAADMLAGAAASDGGAVYIGAGVPRRRSLFSRLLGRH